MGACVLFIVRLTIATLASYVWLKINKLATQKNFEGT